MQIDSSDEHFRKADLPIRKSLDPDSKMTAESWEHPEKQPVHNASTERGRKIEERYRQLEKAKWPIRESFESGSNETAKRHQAEEKQFTEIDSIDEGMQRNCT
jgi:hypothetical protein